ncbi:hypothetical protein PCCS19_18360 [Paenibacillus sp. CCS19]|uniref:hypothetical protein n=1 Tax=Paenibacillus sp. CCS19 TaxID=3158387 RepID=UPI0025602D3F|nr:hypothetical protein [Paenibacillus cellulosilyticus]GMK38782.1 hypothetical protein PCCS19_18360 [Paenibacillus cellulosilyticus]
MSQKHGFMLVIMVWLTFLTIWAVNKVVSTDDEFVTVNGIPIQPTPQPFATVQVDKDTVWIIENNSDMIKIIKHDADGYHLIQERMSFENND